MSSKYKLFVKNLPYLCTSLKLKKHFEKFGDVIYAGVSYNWSTGMSNKYGFVEFKNYEDYKKAIAEETQTLLKEKILVVDEQTYLSRKQQKNNKNQ